MITLFLLFVLNSITLFALSIMFLRTSWSLATNVTTIESWEIERHETLLRRAKALGGYLDGPDGIKVRIVKQEFPYDVGIWKNIVQGMSGGPLTWFWPLARSPPLSSGLWFEVNEFEGQQYDPGRLVAANDLFSRTRCGLAATRSRSNASQDQSARSFRCVYASR